MAKTQEELITLKKEYDTVTAKLKELTQEELLLVTGGSESPFAVPENEEIFNNHIYPGKKPTFEPKF